MADDHYMGKPLGDMGADELRDAVRHLARLLDAARARAEHDFAGLSRIAAAYSRQFEGASHG